MKRLFLSVLTVAVWCALTGVASASLTSAGTFNGNVGLSVDAIGSNNTPVGDVQADIPVGATILQAYLYSAGTPFPWYADSPTTLAAYNGAGITLAGNSITNFSKLVGATATPRPDIGKFFTARADVTALVQSLTAGAVTNTFSWTVDEGRLNNRIDGEVLAIVFSDPSQPTGIVALLDGGQDTGGETSTVNLGAPLGDPTDPGFKAQLGVAVSFSCCGQESTIKINGSTMTTTAGNNDDGLVLQDGWLITAGGLGDPISNGLDYTNNHELYDLAPFLHKGDTSFSIFTQNPTSDDNIFFSSLYLTGKITDVTHGVPEPGTISLLMFGLAGLGARRFRSRKN